MVKSNRVNVGFIGLLVAVAIGGASLGCFAGMHGRDGSQGISEVRSGIDTGREGIQIARDGLASFRAGRRAAGLQQMAQGMDLMNEGMAEVHDGIDMMSGGMSMSGGMMEQCGCDGNQMITSTHQAMADMQRGHDMMSDADPANDEMGADRMAWGMDAMETGYEAADQSISCMDEAQGGGMHNGGMM